MATKDVTVKPKGVGQYLTLVIILIVGLAAVAVIGFYQEEVMGFFRLQAWNMGPVTDGTRQFLQAAKDGNGEKMASFVALDNTAIKETREGGKLVGYAIPIYGGVVHAKLSDFAPTDGTKITGPALSFDGDGMASMEVNYPKKKLVTLQWKRKDNAWKISGIGWASLTP